MLRSLIVLVSIVLTFETLQAQDSKCKCCSEAYRQFDFWVGDWKTFDPNGELVGTNEIKILQDSCIIQENWISSGGKFTGTSYNYYDAQAEQWHQTWIDNQGGSLQLSGSWTDSTMVLKSNPMLDSEGKSYLNKITWTPFLNGNVQQIWEVSKDDGNTWSIVFNGLYKLNEE